MTEFNENVYEEDDENSYMTLTDDNGEDVHFEVLDEFDYDNSKYIVLIPFEDLDDEVVILEVISSEKNDYVSVTDDALLNELFNEFKKRNADIFDFED